MRQKVKKILPRMWQKNFCNLGWGIKEKKFTGAGAIGFFLRPIALIQTFKIMD